MAHDILSPAQLARIVSFLEDEWVDDDDFAATDANLESLLRHVESPLELHFCAMGFDWDTECQTLIHLLRHPLCDYGTALGAFWLAQPASHYGRRRAELDPSEREVRDLLEWIEHRYCTGGFALRTIRLVPTRIGGADFTAAARGRTQWDRPIPEEMFSPSRGERQTVPPALRPYLGDL
jgi:hypothetical protein